MFTIFKKDDVASFIHSLNNIVADIKKNGNINLNITMNGRDDVKIYAKDDSGYLDTVLTLDSVKIIHLQSINPPFRQNAIDVLAEAMKNASLPKLPGNDDSGISKRASRVKIDTSNISELKDANAIIKSVLKDFRSLGSVKSVSSDTDNAVLIIYFKPIYFDSVYDIACSYGEVTTFHFCENQEDIPDSIDDYADDEFEFDIEIDAYTPSDTH